MSIFKKDTRGSGDAGEHNEQTRCEDCGAYIDKINKVLTDSGREFYFCGKCKKPYSRREGGFFTRGVYTYFAEVEVTEEGIPVGYVKAKKK